jgi:hypothetical protein
MTQPKYLKDMKKFLSIIALCFLFSCSVDPELKLNENSPESNDKSHLIQEFQDFLLKNPKVRANEVELKLLKLQIKYKINSLDDPRIISPLQAQFAKNSSNARVACGCCLTGVEIVNEGNGIYGYVYHFSDGSALLNVWDCTSDCTQTSSACYE